MKLPYAQQIKDWDAYTIRQEPVASIDLMERAAGAVVQQLASLSLVYDRLLVFCGKGNNGGDGLAIARMMAGRGANVHVYIMEHRESATADFIENERRLHQQGKCLVHRVANAAALPLIKQSDLVIDALLGTGFNGELSGLLREAVQHINAHASQIVSIDVPSGLPADFAGGVATDAVIVKATLTFTFQVPKLRFMLASSFPYVGKFDVLDIGLHAGFTAQLDTPYHYVDASMVKSLLKPRGKFSHKGTYGHLLAAGGSYGKIGAAVLMAKAALRTGCGLLTAYLPKVGYTIMQAALPEAMTACDESLYELRDFPQVDKYDAVAAGPGMGQHEQTLTGFSKWLKTIDKPCVLDADALNMIAGLLADHRFSFRFPQHCVITPHPKEFDRLAGVANNDEERLHKQVHFARGHNVVVVLKGAHTAVAMPDGNVYFNSTGNPFMATGGSGDVLTGIIGSLLAQGYSMQDAALAGVYMHGLAGDLASANSRTLIASDIIEQIPAAIAALA